MNKFILFFLLMTSVFARTEILEENKTVDLKGNVFYIISVCIDGELYTSVSRENYISMSIAQELVYDVLSHKLVGVKCMYDKKSEQELIK